MMVGLLRPSAGDVRICGYNVVDEARHANRHLGYVPDEPQLYDKLSGREFLNFVADMHGLERPEGTARLSREVQNFELDSFIDDRTETYSHGMKQRLAGVQGRCRTIRGCWWSMSPRSGSIRVACVS